MPSGTRVMPIDPLEERMSLPPTCRSLLTVVVPVAEPMLIAVALRNALTVVGPVPLVPVASVFSNSNVSRSL